MCQCHDKVHRIPFETPYPKLFSGKTSHNYSVYTISLMYQQDKLKQPGDKSPECDKTVQLYYISFLAPCYFSCILSCLFPWLDPCYFSSIISCLN